MPKEREARDVDYPEHPLFPIEEGGKSFEVSFINLARKEAGAMSLVPQLFRSEELTSLDQIVERFGGGTYELTARSNSPMNPGQAYRITKRRLVTLPGKPKPLDPSNPTMQEEVAAGLRPSPFDAPKAPQGIAGDSAVLIAIMQMGQQAAQAAAQQNQQFMALMMQMMQEGKKESAESMRMMMNMMTTMTTSQQQSLMQMLPLLVTTKGGGPAEIEQYLTLFQKMGFGKPEPAPAAEDGESDLNVGEVLSNVATIMQNAPAALSALKEMAPGAPSNGAAGVPGLSAPVEAPPGSAASVLGK